MLLCPSIDRHANAPGDVVRLDLGVVNELPWYRDWCQDRTSCRIRKMRHNDTEIPPGPVLPVLVQLQPVTSFDHHWSQEFLHLEAGSVDDDVSLMEASGRVTNSGLRHTLDRVCHHLDIGALQAS